MVEPFHQWYLRMVEEIAQIDNDLGNFTPTTEGYHEWVEAYHSSVMLQWEMSVRDYSVKELFTVAELRAIPTRIG